MEVELRLHTQIIEHLAEGVFLIRALDQIIIYANPKFEQMFGYNLKELYGKHAGIVHAPSKKSYNEITLEIAESLIQKGSWQGEIKNIKKDKNICWCRVNISAFDHPQYGKVWISIHDDITVYKKSEEILRESEEKYRLLHENSGIGVGYYKPDGTVISYNRIAAIHMNGVPKDFTGKSIYDLFPKEDAEFYHNRIKEATLSDKPVVYEDLVPLPTGNKYFLSTFSKIVDCNNIISGIQIISQDITKHIQVEKALQESEETLNQILEVLPIGLWIMDKDGKIVGGNKAGQRIWSGAKYVGLDQLSEYKAWRLKTGEPINPEEWASSKAIRKGIITIDEELEIECFDGTHKIILNSAIPLFDDQHRVTGAIIINQDITERKKVEETLLIKDWAINSTFNAIAISGLDGIINFVNPAFLKIWGYGSASEVLEKIVTEFWHIEEKASEVIDALHKSGGWIGEMVGQGKNGNLFDIRIIASMVFDSNGRPICMQASFEDITIRKQSENALKESERLYRSLFENMINGFAYCQMHFDENARPIDFTYLSVNDAFETQTGLKNVVGKKVSEVIPGIYETDPELFEIYGRVSKTGKPERFEIFLDSLQMWTLISVYCPKSGNIVTVFDVITEEKLAEQTLKESVEKYHNLFRNAALGIFHSTLDGKFIDVNPALVKMLGYSSSEELLSQVTNISEQIYAEPPKRNEIASKAMESGGFVSTENLYRRKDGTIWNGMLHMHIVPEKAGKPSYFEGFIEDITDRKQAEQSLAYERQRLSYIIKGTDAGTWEWNIQTGETIFNEQWAEIIGYTLDEISPVSIETWKKHTHPEDLKISGELLEKHFKGQLDYYECEARMKHKNGKWVWILDRGKVHEWDKEGKPLLMSGTHQDITKRKQAEKALRESEKRHRTILQTAIDGFWLADLQGNLLEVNESYCRMSGYSNQELLNMKISDLEVIDASYDVEAHIKKIISEGEDRFETRHQRKDGSIFDIEISVKYQPNSGGRLVAFLHDITKRKQANEALLLSKEKVEESEKFLIRAQKTAHIGHWNWDLIKLQLSWSDEIFNILGVSKDTFQVLSVNYEGAIHPDDLDLFRQKREKALNNDIELDIVYRIIRPSGEVRFVQECSKILRNTQNEPVSVFGTVHDITERKQFEDDLRILSWAVEQSPVSVIITDIDGIIEYVNPKFTKVTGYSFEEAFGKNPNILKSDFTSGEEYLNLWQTIKSGNEWSGEFCNKKKTGELFWESALISPITNEKGDIIHFIAVKEDITQHKETSRIIQSSIIEAEERERMNFSQELHDGIGPLLSATKMYVQWLGLPNAKLNQAEIIKDIEQFLDESSRTVREISFKLSPHVLLNYGLVEAVKAFTEKIKESSNVVFEIKTQNDCRFDKNSETIAYRVLCECINNTIKHAKASDIFINMRCLNDLLFVDYSDNGKGFDVDKVISEHKGIGLLNMKSRIKSINGLMDIISSPGKGTIIKFQIKI